MLNRIGVLNTRPNINLGGILPAVRVRLNIVQLSLWQLEVWRLTPDNETVLDLVILVELSKGFRPKAIKVRFT
jgi:hypothetical protein